MNLVMSMFWEKEISITMKLMKFHQLILKWIKGKLSVSISKTKKMIVVIVDFFIRNCLNFRAIKELPMRQKHSVTKSVKDCTLKGVEGNHAHGFNI